MNRSNPRQPRRRQRYRARRTGRGINQTQTGTIQPFGGVSHLDETPHIRKFTYNVNFAPALNTHGGVGYGIGSLAFTPNTQLTNELKAMSRVYEQYQVTRMEIYATPGKGFSADNKFKLRLYTRVDPDDRIQANTNLNYYFSIRSGQNTVMHTFAEKSRVKVADFRPKLFAYSDSQADTPILPSQLQWYPLDSSHYINQRWAGLMMAGNMPAEGDLTGLDVKIDVSITIKFRGRVISDRAFPQSTVALEDSINISVGELFIAAAPVPIDESGSDSEEIPVM